VLAAPFKLKLIPPMPLSQILTRFFLLILLVPLYWGLSNGCTNLGGGSGGGGSGGQEGGPGLGLTTPRGPLTEDGTGPGGSATPPGQHPEGTPRDPPLYAFVYKCNSSVKSHSNENCKSNFQIGERVTVQTFTKEYELALPDSGGGGEGFYWKAGSKAIYALLQGVPEPKDVFKWAKILANQISALHDHELKYQVTYFDSNWVCYRGDCGDAVYFPMSESTGAYKTTCWLSPDEFSKCAPEVSGSVCYISGSGCNTLDSAPKVARWRRDSMHPPTFTKDKTLDSVSIKTTGFKDSDVKLLNRSATLSYTVAYCSSSKSCYTGLCQKTNQSSFVQLPLPLDREGIELSCKLKTDGVVPECKDCIPPNPVVFFEDLPDIPPKGGRPWEDPGFPSPGDGGEGIPDI